MVARLFIQHVVLVRDMSSQRARLELGRQVRHFNSDDDERLRRRIAIAAQPVRIDAAERARQSVRAAVQIKRARLAVIPRENSRARFIVRGQRVVNPRDRLRQFRPADLFAQVAVDTVDCVPQC